MTDSRQAQDIFGGEPARDARLGALLAGVLGPVPEGDVDWTALGARLAQARARQRGSWLAYAARWERRAIPVAIAASLAGVLALWSLGMPAATRVASTVAVSDPVAAMVEGTTADDAARTFLRSVTTSEDPSLLGAY